MKCSTHTDGCHPLARSLPAPAAGDFRDPHSVTVDAVGDARADVAYLAMQAHRLLRDTGVGFWRQLEQALLFILGNIDIMEGRFQKKRLFLSLLSRSELSSPDRRDAQGGERRFPGRLG